MIISTTVVVVPLPCKKLPWSPFGPWLETGAGPNDVDCTVAFCPGKDQQLLDDVLGNLSKFNCSQIIRDYWLMNIYKKSVMVNDSLNFLIYFIY